MTRAVQIAESVMRLPGRYLSIKDIQNVALNQRDVLRVNSPTGCNLSGLQGCGVGSRERSGYHGDNEDVGSRRICLAYAGKLSECLDPRRFGV